MSPFVYFFYYWLILSLLWFHTPGGETKGATGTSRVHVVKNLEYRWGGTSRVHSWIGTSVTFPVSKVCSSVPDRRTDPWPLVYSPVPVALIFLVYLSVVWAGPRLMRHRKPFDLKVVLIVYNFAMVGMSAYMFHEVCLCADLCPV